MVIWSNLSQSDSVSLEFGIGADWNLVSFWIWIELSSINSQTLGLFLSNSNRECQFIYQESENQIRREKQKWDIEEKRGLPTFLKTVQFLLKIPQKPRCLWFPRDTPEPSNLIFFQQISLLSFWLICFLKPTFKQTNKKHTYDLYIHIL